jgi:hypothetical protein
MFFFVKLGYFILIALFSSVIKGESLTAKNLTTKKKLSLVGLSPGWIFTKLVKTNT